MGMTPEKAYRITCRKGPFDHTRIIVCENPWWAYLYTLHIDKEPREDTRLAACKDPYYAYKYALNVDKCPRDSIRKADCRNSINRTVHEVYHSAYWYSKDVDKWFRLDTYLIASKESQALKMYDKWLSSKIRDQREKVL